MSAVFARLEATAAAAVIDDAVMEVPLVRRGVAGISVHEEDAFLVSCLFCGVLAASPNCV